MGWERGIFAVGRAALVDWSSNSRSKKLKAAPFLGERRFFIRQAFTSAATILKPRDQDYAVKEGWFS